MYELDFETLEWERKLGAPLPAVPAAKAEPMALLEERCTVINNALLELMERVYNWGADAVAFDGRLTCGTPMGKKGHKEYGLTPTEREILRTHLLLRSQGDEERRAKSRPWLYYNESTRAWYANIEERPVYEAAVAWLMRNGLAPFFYNRAKEVANGSSG